MNTDDELCRLTLLTPSGRVEVAAPAAPPLADLLPDLLQHVPGASGASGTASRRGGGTDSRTGVRPGAIWVLQRLGGAPLDPGKSLAASGVLDGDVLHVRPVGDALPPSVFHDVADAAAAATRARTNRWQRTDSRTACLAAACLVLVIGAAALAASGSGGAHGAALSQSTVASTSGGGSWPVVSAVAAAVSVLLIGCAAYLARGLRDAVAGAVIGCCALPFAAVAGAAGAAGTRTLSHFGAQQVLTGGAAMVIAAALAGLAAAGPNRTWTTPVFVGAGVLGFLPALGGGIAGWWPDGGRAGASAAVVCLGLLLTALAPATALRLAGLSPQGVPGNAEQMRADDERVDGLGVGRRSAVADSALSALLVSIGLADIGAFAQLTTPRSGNSLSVYCALALVACAALVTVLRSRSFAGRTQRLALFVPALAAAALLARYVSAHGGTAGGLGVAAGSAAAALGLIAAATSDHSRAGHPYRDRAADLIETVAALATLPLAFEVLAVFGHVRSS
ncbi:type VII secretion integral membrane protein EccD [Catenulispora sp. NL8]|uniref:Type VII secretion integral membrane protein EccD n=1 Tax=Catenulispora pinistramenti TaxID=2705254 RepID=A0ABS5L329_9ACTN|nr:type VII secretion integral membrane protein EccD [Catenulispora pinistramenti]MBS2552741.1 type VII secretion integral membrane protein EccD [Catenulispora pinistramenti]